MSDDALAELERLISGMPPEEIAALDALIAEELSQAFLPNPGPQSTALNCDADILLYGGQAGGGKSALEVGAWFDGHHSGLVLRREAVQLDGLIQFCKEIGEPRFGRFVGGNENVFKRNDGGRLRFAGLNQPDDWRKHAGNARDYIAFDEAGEFLKEQVFSLIGWLRSTHPGQRCRVILGSNPPRGGDGEWLIEEFAPWLDPLHPNPAKPGELRWAIVVASDTEWVSGPGVYVRGGEDYEAMSRSFIPASLSDNPYLRDTNYRAKLQGLPEPLRSQLLKGDFLAGREDHEWQIIPTDWVRLAQERWERAEPKRRRMLALAADVAGGLGDATMLAALHEDNWFAPLVEVKLEPGADPVSFPSHIASKMLLAQKDGADLSLDGTGGWGSGVRSSLKDNHGVTCEALIFSAGSNASTKDGKLEFKNLRAQMYWQLREALDPDGGEDVMLPPSKRLAAQLTAGRYLIKGVTIQVEDKAEIIKRIGSSPDDADSVVIAWKRRNAAGKAASRAAVKVKTRPPIVRTPGASGTGWMR